MTDEFDRAFADLRQAIFATYAALAQRDGMTRCSPQAEASPRQGRADDHRRLPVRAVRRPI